MNEQLTVFRNCAWVVGFDRAQQTHVYRRDVDVAIESGVVTFVGDHYDGVAYEEVDCRERLLMPGLVNIHSHPSSEPLRKGITDETLSPGFHHSSLYEFLTVFDNDEEGQLLKS